MFGLSHPRSCFFEQPQFERLLGDDFLQVLRLAPALLDLIGRRSASVSPASRRLPAIFVPRARSALQAARPN
jgi:hypothetical protein